MRVRAGSSSTRSRRKERRLVSGYSTIPLTVEFDGNFYELSDFLFRVRNLVRVQAGVLDAQGRLFVVDAISFGESTKAFPQIKASLTVHAFVYGDLSVVVPPVTPTAACHDGHDVDGPDDRAHHDRAVTRHAA